MDGMFAHSYYWIGYGVFLALTGVTMIVAMYARKKSEGIPFNYRLMALNWGTCWVMWTAVAITEYLYNPNPVTVAFLQAVLGIWVVGGIVWQGKGAVMHFFAPKEV